MRSTSPKMNCALAIGGLDPGGGAGIVADLRAFAAAGAFGCAAIAVVTVQSTRGMKSARAVDARELAAQVREVMRVQRVRAIKVGALGSRANVLAVARLLAAAPSVPAIVDTPMLASRASRGARLLDAHAIDAMRDVLLPRAALVTVNVAEAEELVGIRVGAIGDAHDAALALCRLGARAALVKGGHLGGGSAIDVLAIGGEAIELRAKRIEHASPHGTGCTFASLVAGRIAAQDGRASVVDAVRWAKRVHHGAIARARDVGGTARVLAFG
jgi:hydroxymethylpyrimidine kinase/phosphomethylpyrimidine kinase